jgi:hypothetical protein
MLHKICFLFLLFILTVFIVDVRTVSACSCAGTPTVLSQYEWAKNIVIVRAVSFEKSETGIDGIASTKMVVEKVFKGDLKAGDEMVFAQGGGGDCIWTFQKKDAGKQFLFYLYEKKDEQKVWFISICGRSRQLERAADDLLYLENIDKVRGKTRLSGTLMYRQAPARDGEEWISRTLDGRKVRIIREKKTYELTTNSQGVYEIYDLPPGIYTVEPEAFDGWKLDDSYPSNRPEISKIERNNIEKTKKREAQIVVEAGKHAYFEFEYTIDNVIQGKVLDATGKGMKDVCLNLVPEQGKAANYFRLSDCTDEDGVFEMKSIPPGRYLIVVNDDGKISSSEPFNTFYYPNTFEREKAGIIAIGAGNIQEDMNIYVPEMKEVIIVEGTLLYEDGQPVVDTYVQFKADNASASIEGKAHAKTDGSGKFSINILKGLKGKLYSEMYIYTGKFENCPKIAELLRKKGTDSTQIQTTAFEIRADENISKIVLKYPFPYCKKAKSEDDEK